jgi:8-oxo-dGTP pyrophosphatase MutT (NUDIX family)
MIMNLRKILGYRTTAEKLEDYRALKERLNELSVVGKGLADKFMFQKSMVDGIELIPEAKRGQVLDSYKTFVQEHSKEVAKAVSERERILKSIEKYRNDPEIKDACQNIDTIDTATIAYRAGNLKKDGYFTLLKSLTGEPTKYADVIAFNRDGKMLVLHRVTELMCNGTVCVPGGHVDLGEDFLVAALRELKEETNLDPLDGGIEELGEYRSEDAHIKYYKIYVDELQPVTLDATEHCFYEWIDIAEIPLKPFIFDQGKNILKLLTPEGFEEKVTPLLKAYHEGRIEKAAFIPAYSFMLAKALGVSTETEGRLMPESLEGSNGKRKRAIVPVRDPKKNVERILKAVSGEAELYLSKSLKLEKPFIIHEVTYKRTPETNYLTELELVYEGDEAQVRQVLKVLKDNFLRGDGVKVKTSHEEFLAANEHGTDYVGDPIFVELETVA